MSSTAGEEGRSDKEQQQQQQQDCPRRGRCNDHNDNDNDNEAAGPWELPAGAAVVVRQIVAERILHDTLQECKLRRCGRDDIDDDDNIDDNNNKSNRQWEWIVQEIVREFPATCARTYAFGGFDHAPATTTTTTTTVQNNQENATTGREDHDRDHDDEVNSDSPSSSKTTTIRWMTPLTMVCVLQPSLSVVRAVYEAYPAALRTPDARWRALPLHYACSFRANVEVVQFLLHQAPGWSIQHTRHDGAGPLTMACCYHASREVVQTLIETHPASIQYLWEGWLPLHLAVAFGASQDVVKILHEAYPPAVTATHAVTGQTALHIACRETTTAPEEQQQQQQQTSDNDTTTTTTSCRDDDDDDDEELLLHDAESSRKPGNPGGVVRYLLSVTTAEDALHCRDRWGQTPWTTAVRYQSKAIIQQFVHKFGSSQTSTQAQTLPFLALFSINDVAEPQQLDHNNNNRDGAVQHFQHHNDGYQRHQQLLRTNPRAAVNLQPRTILHMAVVQNSLDVVQYLCRRFPHLVKPPPEVLQYFTMTTTTMAAGMTNNNNKNTSSDDADADDDDVVNVVWWRTALHTACRHHRTTTVQFLVQEHPLSLFYLDHNGETPLEVALRSHAPATLVDYLRQQQQQLPKLQKTPKATTPKATMRYP